METPSNANGRRPAVLVLAGLDPSGGAGIQADIGTIMALGVHAAPVVTVLTVQDTVDVRACRPVDPALIVEQASVVLADLDVRAIKIGLLGEPSVLEAVAGICRLRPEIPVVLDPVLTAGGGYALGGSALRRVLFDTLLPMASIVTPNGPELHALSGLPASDDEAARRLLATGCRHVLVTGGHGAGETVVDVLHDRNGPVVSWESPRRPGRFHGTGCTLASAIAAGLAQDRPVTDAVGAAVDFVQRAIGRAYRVGRGQLVLETPRTP